MKIIPVKIRNKSASRPMLVDDWDYEILKNYQWHESFGYARMRKKRSYVGEKTQQILAHRLILWCPKKMETDHINGNRLDNRKENLRIVTRSQNSQNKGKRKKEYSSKFKGVSLIKESSKWYAGIRINKKSLNIGHYNNEVDAARAYDEKAKELFGEYAWLNFPS